MSEVQEWHASLAKGRNGVVILTDLLRQQGRHVVDLDKVMTVQRMGVDLLVDGHPWEVKTCSYDRSNTVFLETTVDGKPGCLYSSRAEVWAYIFPKCHVCYLFSLPYLQWEVGERQKAKERKSLTSKWGTRTWEGEGVVVRVDSLVHETIQWDEGVVRLIA